jgi:hypothetical protein
LPVYLSLSLFPFAPQIKHRESRGAFCRKNNPTLSFRSRLYRARNLLDASGKTADSSRDNAALRNDNMARTDPEANHVRCATRQILRGLKAAQDDAGEGS